MRVALAVGAVVGALALVACGDDDNGDGGDSFVADADALCGDAAVERTEVDQRIGSPDSDADAIELVEGSTAIEEDLIAELAELEPPEDAAEAFDALIAARQEAVDMGEEAIAAAEQSDPERFNEISAERDAALDEARESAEEAGLETCAQVLPEEAEAEIATAIEESVTAADVACEDRYTENYIEVYYGGDVEACEADEAAADSVEVTEVRGVEGASAEATATLVGGRNDGEAFDVDLLEEDGAWKLDAINPAGQ